MHNDGKKYEWIKVEASPGSDPWVKFTSMTWLWAKCERKKQYTSRWGSKVLWENGSTKRNLKKKNHESKKQQKTIKFFTRNYLQGYILLVFAIIEELWVFDTLAVCGGSLANTILKKGSVLEVNNFRLSQKLSFNKLVFQDVIFDLWKNLKRNLKIVDDRMSILGIPIALKHRS